MSDAHAEGDGHTAVGHVTLIGGPGDRFLSGVSYYTALLTSPLAERGPVAMLLLRRVCPRAVVILQWWTATVLHSYLVLAWVARRSGARLVVELRKVQDVGEARLPLVSRYTRAGMRLVSSRADAVVVQSEFDRLAMQDSYPQLATLPVEVVPLASLAASDACQGGGLSPQHPPRPGEPIRLLIFGVVRPYEGHAELVAAVRLLTTSGLDLHVKDVE